MPRRAPIADISAFSASSAPPRPSMHMHPSAPSPRTPWTALLPLPPCPFVFLPLPPENAPLLCAPVDPTEGPSGYQPFPCQMPTPMPHACPTAWQWVRGSQTVLYATTRPH